MCPGAKYSPKWHNCITIFFYFATRSLFDFVIFASMELKTTWIDTVVLVPTNEHFHFSAIDVHSPIDVCSKWPRVLSWRQPLWRMSRPANKRELVARTEFVFHESSYPARHACWMSPRSLICIPSAYEMVSSQSNVAPFFLMTLVILYKASKISLYDTTNSSLLPLYFFPAMQT